MRKTSKNDDTKKINKEIALIANSGIGGAGVRVKFCETDTTKSMLEYIVTNTEEAL